MNFILQWFIFFFEYLFSLIFIIYFVQLIHESGKVIFALLSGYQFVSLNFLWFTLIRKNQKLRFRIHRTIFDTDSNVVPVKFSSKLKFRPYFYGGIIFDLLFGTIAGILWYFLPKISLILRIDLIIFIIICTFNFLNCLPLNWFGVPTDFKNISAIKKSPDALFGYYVSLVASYLAINEIPLTQYSEKLFYQSPQADHRNFYVMSQDWLKAAYLEQQVFQNGTGDDLLGYIDQLLPFLNYAPKTIRAQYLNEAIFIDLIANYRTKWAIKQWNSSLITHYSMKQNYPTFIKTIILTEIINQKNKYLQTDFKEGIEILQQAQDQINDLYLMKNLQKKLPEWQTILRRNHGLKF